MYREEIVYDGSPEEGFKATIDTYISNNYSNFDSKLANKFVVTMSPEDCNKLHEDIMQFAVNAGLVVMSKDEFLDPNDLPKFTSFTIPFVGNVRIQETNEFTNKMIIEQIC